MIVAIHQPNYAPWLGYFAKLARADVFVTLDDVQFSKNSYTNRVQVDSGGQPRWLSVPVSFRFGDAINTVRASDPKWPQGHLDKLKSYYAKAAYFGEVWDWLVPLLSDLPIDSIAASNQTLIEAITARLDLKCRILRASEMDLGEVASDDRLIAILQRIGPKVSYLSGKGGAKYQAPAKFEAAGIPLLYSDFTPRPYNQGHEDFVPGLSVLDALFRLGFEGTAALTATSLA